MAILLTALPSLDGFHNPEVVRVSRAAFSSTISDSNAILKKEEKKKPCTVIFVLCHSEINKNLSASQGKLAENNLIWKSRRGRELRVGTKVYNYFL